MRINKGIYLVLALLFACTTGMTQMTAASFKRSPVAMITTSSTTIGGTVAVFNGGNKCLNVVSGLSAISTIATNGTGKFGASCAEVAPVADVLTITSITVYPNPTHSLTTLKCDGVFDANLFGQVRIISMDGRVMMSQMIPMQDLKAGHILNVASYAAGTYVVSVDFMNKHYTTKLIKI
ncbi:T9SS type A sorting domain-containing protein [Sediminibacterium roseum]|uniref:T9SS type A sorting domain-containing protein n=1 Tax=Sediminibacterium roseum TaxID=1978412 RepID=A0ABW9ZQ74_9BACT|nr:T9SS type A sorting domain-containing protein [Sediminibacterium roseum]NCI49247.1 T9SS type A sorting domain-containing protein [Sediminibacterium roseum]